MSGTTTVTGSSGETITLLNEPGTIVQSVAGAGGNFVASIHATGTTSVLEAVFHANNTAVTGWNTITLDANGNATIPVHFDQTGEYLNLLSADSTTNVVSFPVTLTSPTVGATTITATTPNQTVTLPAGDTVVFVTVPDTILQSGGASTIISGGGNMTLAASAGSQVIFDSVGGDKIAEAPTSEFFGGPAGAASTINAAAGGSDTILAGGAILYNGAGGTNSLMVGGTGAATVTAATNETLFGGTGGGLYVPGSGNFFFFGGGAADTIAGGAGGAPTVWGNTNETLTASNTAAHGIFIAFGNNDSINASTSAGSDNFLVVNQALSVPGGTFSGNTTLVGSNAGGDAFAVFSEPGAAPPAHTIDIQNWQATDTFFLGNYSATDVNAANAALQAAPVGGGASFTLSDQTTIMFVGAHPTTAFS